MKGRVEMPSKMIVHTERGLAELTYDGTVLCCIRPMTWANLHEYLSWMAEHLEDVFPGIGAKDRETALAFLSEAQTKVQRTQG